MTTPANPDDLIAFVRAQLDDDERLVAEYERHMTERAAAAGSYVPVIPPGWQPGEPFDPDRQRAEVDAKRRILDEAEQYSPELEHGDNGEWAFGAVLRLLALPYADRPGYRAEWAVTE